jgi:polar amino acid transport system substrate-binding protein
MKPQLSRLTRRRGFTCLAIGAVALLAAGCGSSGGSGSAGRLAATSAAGTAAAGLPAGALGQSGTIRFCSDISSPPLEFYANGQQPSGSDIDLGNAIAGQLGLKPVWVNTAFAGIIPALQAGHCDAIMSQLLDKPARRATVNFVDYMNSSEAIMVRAGNPGHITGLSGLCGLTVAAETGTTVADYLATQSKTCTASGKKPISVQTFLRDSDALSQLGLGHVAAYGTTVESGGYDISKNGGVFQLAGPAFGQIATGIATTKKDTALHDAIARAFAALRANGTYKQIMTKWGLVPDELAG